MVKIAIIFGGPCIKGSIHIVRGTFERLDTHEGIVRGNEFESNTGSEHRLEVTLGDACTSRGAHPTIINVMCGEASFSFNLRDVCSEHPIYIPEFAAVVVPGNDARTFKDVAQSIAERHLLDDFARFETEAEESLENCSRHNRRQQCQTWLGLGRDMRMFRVGYQGMSPGADTQNHYWGRIQPCYHSFAQSLPGIERSFYQIDFEIGQGASCRPLITRRLENGILPILRSVQYEQDVEYHVTAFATLENEPLKPGALRGSDWRASYANTGGCMLSTEERSGFKQLLNSEMREREQEVVCCMRVEAANRGNTPRYAWFKAPRLAPFAHLSLASYPIAHSSFISHSGQSVYEKGFSLLEPSKHVMAVTLLDGTPLGDEEIAILVQPGEKAVFDILIPHSPVNRKRGEKLSKLDVEAHLEACRIFWQDKLKHTAGISVPEQHIQESVDAGLLHCDLATLGLEHDGTALATIGCYSPIGTESAPIIQYYDSVGWHELAERCLQFFFDRQREDGFIQNFANYQSETGAFLWTVGEHYRYTLDRDWLERVLPNIKKAVGYLLAWRERNKKEEFREKGFYGMIDGKVADPEDYYHSFFLNAGTYVGLKRMAEVCAEIDPEYAAKLETEITAYRQDIRNGFYYSQARAPVIPVGDGSWAPLMPPWVEYTGSITLYADGGNWFSHGAFASRSSLTGPLWLIISEVLEPDEIGTRFLIKTNQYPVTLENAALSQPYYCRHDYAHLRRRETKAFLKTYYNQLSALQDPETYSWWEHYFHASEHKTHEEAWFLMQTRWMLWLEEGERLSLLRGIPRRWMEDGKEIVLTGIKSYFGAMDFKAVSEVDNGRITAEVSCAPKRAPKEVEIRLPHPDGLPATTCSNGKYDPRAETVTMPTSNGKARVVLSFQEKTQPNTFESRFSINEDL